MVIIVRNNNSTIQFTLSLVMRLNIIFIVTNSASIIEIPALVVIFNA